MLLEKHCDQCWSKRVAPLRGWAFGLEPAEKRKLIRDIKHNPFLRFSTDFICWEKSCLSAWENKGIYVWVWFTLTITQAAWTPTVFEHYHRINKIPLPREMHLPLGVSAFLVYSDFIFSETKATTSKTEWVFRHHPRFVSAQLQISADTSSWCRGWTQNSGSASLFTKHGPITVARMFYSGGQHLTTLVFTSVKCLLYARTSLSTEIAISWLKEILPQVALLAYILFSMALKYTHEQLNLQYIPTWSVLLHNSAKNCLKTIKQSFRQF